MTQEEANKRYIDTRVNVIDSNLKALDELFNEELNETTYASEEHKQAQRKSNAILRLQQALDNLKYEL